MLGNGVEGGCAALVAVDAAEPTEVPDGLAPGEAVALLADGRTALARPGRRPSGRGSGVAVTATADGVGGLLLQLALRAGADAVVGLAGGGRFLVFGAAGGPMTSAADAERPRAHRDHARVHGPRPRRPAGPVEEGARAGSTAGRLRPTIGQRVPFAEAAAAHAAIESRATIGTTLLIP